MGKTRKRVSSPPPLGHGVQVEDTIIGLKDPSALWQWKTRSVSKNRKNKAMEFTGRLITPSRFPETFLELLILQSHSDKSTGRTVKCIRNKSHVPYVFAMCKPTIVDWNRSRALSAKWLLQIIIKQEYTMKQQSNAWHERPSTVPMYMIYEEATIPHTWARKVTEQT